MTLDLLLDLSLIAWARLLLIAAAFLALLLLLGSRPARQGRGCGRCGIHCPGANPPSSADDPAPGARARGARSAPRGGRGDDGGAAPAPLPAEAVTGWVDDLKAALADPERRWERDATARRERGRARP